MLILLLLKKQKNKNPTNTSQNNKYPNQPPHKSQNKTTLPHKKPNQNIKNSTQNPDQTKPENNPKMLKQHTNNQQKNYQMC